MVNPRKLAAIDIAFLGPRVIIAEFAAGVLLCTALGAFVLYRGGGTVSQLLLGLYLISLGINYLPMLIYAVMIGGTNRARAELGAEIGAEPGAKRVAMAKYRRQSLWLLVPLIVPVMALAQRKEQE